MILGGEFYFNGQIVVSLLDNREFEIYLFDLDNTLYDEIDFVRQVLYSYLSKIGTNRSLRYRVMGKIEQDFMF